MTRTSKTLKRLGIAGLAVATIGAGAPALIASAAQAAGPVTSVTITPTAKQGSAGTCLNYTIHAQDATATAVSGATVTVSVTTDGATAGQDVDFCSVAQSGYVAGSTTTPAPQSGTVVSNQGPQTPPGTSTDVARFVTDASGNATFGIVSNTAGSATISSFIDSNSNGTFDAGELAGGGATATFTAGGPAGSNANQNAASTVTVAPTTDSAVVGESRTFTVTVKNASGDTLAGVTPSYTVSGAETQGPNACPSTDNNGVSKCTVTFTKAGTDTVTFFVNQNAAGSTPGPDASEPKATATVTVQAAPTAGAQTLTATCQPVAGGQPETTTTPCVNEVQDASRVVRFIVDNSSSTNTTSTVGTLLNFTVSGSSTASVTPTECSTANYTAAGTSTTDSFCDVTVTDTKPVAGEVLTVTGTIRGTTTKASATVTYTNSATDARNIALAPKTATTTPGTVRTFTATVTDGDGKPVANVGVTFTESGAGAFRNGSSTTFATTDANGQATADVTSLSNETGTETITATINSFGTQCGNAANTGNDPRGTAYNSTTNTVSAGNCSDSATNTFATPSPSPSSSTTPPSGRQALALVVNTPTINAGTQGKMTVTGSANQAIQLVCYTRPSTTYKVARNATINAAGDPVVFTLSLGMNTRCFAQYATNSAQDASPSGVINVKTVVSIFVVRNATRDYTFQGHNLPKYAGQLITLYYVNSNGDNVRKGFVKTDSTGIYHIPVKFVSNGTFTFFVRTGQTLTNAAGESNHVSVSIH